MQDGVVVVMPHLPSTLSPSEAVAAQRTMLDRLISTEDITRYVLWYYTPLALRFSDHLEPVRVAYDCMDELSAFKGASSELPILERRLLRRADVVFTGGQSLFEAKKTEHPNIHAMPSSVDVAHFATARHAVNEPPDQRDIPTPRLGFFGVLDERLDIALVEGLADARPDWQLVMVGPVVKIDPADLPRRSNIHYLGAKTYAELPLYLAGWDVALLPFARNEATRFISPTKTPEYLAAGRPVVSTSIRDVVTPYGDLGLVAIADTVDEIRPGVRRCLERARRRRPRQGRWVSARHVVGYAPGVGCRDCSTAQLRLPIPLGRGSPHQLPPSPAPACRGRLRGLRVRLSDRRRRLRRRDLAERLATHAGKRVLVCDKRPHIGGNAYDYYDEHGILIHKYGPHIFHTNSAEVFDYLSRFTEWRPYQHRVRASVDGQLVPIPINLDTINQLYGTSFTSLELEAFFASVAEPRTAIKTSEDVIVSRVGRELYEKFFRNYTRKQWGLDPSELDASVTSRVPVRTNRDDRYFTDTYQAMPRRATPGCSSGCCDHPNINVLLNTDYREVRSADSASAPDLHRARRRVFRLPLRQAAVPLAAVRMGDAGRRAGPAGAGHQLPERSSRTRA